MANARHVATVLPLLLVGGLFLFLAIPKQSNQEPAEIEVFLGANGEVVRSQDFFVRPFISDFGETGISFDGGKYPIYDHRLPRIEFGEKGGARRLQLTMLTDWTNPECRKTYHLIHTLYASEDGEKLPAIDLFLLPVYVDEPGRMLHESVLTIFFGSNRIDVFGDILAEIAEGTLAADSQAVQKQISAVDPDLASRWEPLSNNLKERYGYTFNMAFLQNTHNKKRLNRGIFPQLIVFDSILGGYPSQASLARFLRNSAARQDEYFNSPEGATPLVIDRSCNCNDPTHNHMLLQTDPTITSANKIADSVPSPLFASDPEVISSEK